MHPASGPYAFIREQHDADLVIRPVLRVTDSTAFAPDREPEFVQPFTAQHWGMAEALIRDPDGRTVSLEAPTADATGAPPGGHGREHESTGARVPEPHRRLVSRQGGLRPVSHRVPGAQRRQAPGTFLVVDMGNDVSLDYHDFYDPAGDIRSQHYASWSQTKTLTRSSAASILPGRTIGQIPDSGSKVRSTATTAAAGCRRLGRS